MLAATLLLEASARGADRTAQLWTALPLESLGVPAIPQQFLSVGLSMLTVDFVDDTHLLVTFGTRGLIPRVPGDPPTDDDRMVAAELVEVPSGNVVARTEWHMHDHGQYLWRLGHGRFLVRTRDTLFALTPKALMNSPNPLMAISFPQEAGRPVVVLLSPDASLVTVERLLTPLPAALEQATMQRTAEGDVDDEDRPKPQVTIDFYRVEGGDDPEHTFSVGEAGAVRAPGLFALPMDHDGYLWTDETGNDRWTVSFDEYNGKQRPAATLDSSCVPRLQMVSRFEFVAFACEGSEDRLKLKSFGMDGHETWEESFGPPVGQPVFAFAPEAGRFAMSRISSNVGDASSLTMVPDGSTQEVRVYQTESGDLLLKAACDPVERNAENFDLSEDGLLAAVVNHGAIEIYKLPPPSKRDVKDLATAAGFAPPAFDGPVRLARLEVRSNAASAPEGAANNVEPATRQASSAAGAAAVKSENSAASPAAGKGPNPAKAAPLSAPGSNEGEDEPRRKPPTLLEPGEQPEFRGATATTQPE